MELLPRFRLCLGFRKEFEVHAAAGSTIVRLRGIAAYHRLGRRMQRQRPVEGRPIRKDGQATLVVSQASETAMLEGSRDSEIATLGRGGERRPGYGVRMQCRRPVRGRPIRKDGQAATAVSPTRQIATLDGIWDS